MRKNLTAKAYVYPLPVLIVGTYDENGIPNAMNAAWGTVCDTAQVAISLSAHHKTVQNLLKTKAFTVSMATADTVVACDYVGVESADNVPDKFARAGFHAVKSGFVNAPLIAELPLSLECVVKSYEDEILVGEIVNVSVDESVLTDGKIDMAKLNPIAYNPITHAYVTFGETVGTAFSDGMKLKTNS